MIAVAQFPTLLRFPLGGAQEELKRVSRMFSGAFRKPFQSAFASGDAAAITTLIYDTFTGANGTALASHTIAPTNTVGASWTAQIGTWQISGNTAITTVNTSYGHVTLDATVADCTITADIQVNTSSGGPDRVEGLVMRWSASNTFWIIGLSSTRFYLTQRNAGVDTEMAFTTGTFTAGTVYTIQVILSAATITATVNGANQILYASATLNQTATIHGMLSGRANQTHDNFKVTVP